jgi:hypothetical protein
VWRVLENIQYVRLTRAARYEEQQNDETNTMTKHQDEEGKENTMK